MGFPNPRLIVGSIFPLESLTSSSAVGRETEVNRVKCQSWSPSRFSSGGVSLKPSSYSNPNTVVNIKSPKPAVLKELSSFFIVIRSENVKR